MYLASSCRCPGQASGDSCEEKWDIWVEGQAFETWNQITHWSPSSPQHGSKISPSRKREEACTGVHSTVFTFIFKIHFICYKSFTVVKYAYQKLYPPNRFHRTVRDAKHIHISLHHRRPLSPELFPRLRLKLCAHCTLAPPPRPPVPGNAILLSEKSLLFRTALNLQEKWRGQRVPVHPVSSVINTWTWYVCYMKEPILIAHY